MLKLAIIVLVIVVALLRGGSLRNFAAALAELRRRGFDVVDTDESGLDRAAPATAATSARGSDRRAACARPGRHAVRLRHGLEPGPLLPAVRRGRPPERARQHLVPQIESRTTNPYGKSPEERQLILDHLAEVEPLLRATCTHEIDASRPLEHVVAALVAIGADV